jgi:DNA invertase Pin-like site-specific DNA recombinase
MVAKPMDGYIRVSRRQGREGPGYISPLVQREAIERWAEYKGVRIAEWHVDEDESGGTHDRPGLNAAVERATGGVTGGIVSWKIDRFSRFTEHGLRDLRELEAAGARLAFVTEDIDTSGPMGKFVYTVMLAMAEYYLDTIKAGWRTAKGRAVERGAHIGPTPFGYRRRQDGTLAVDPVEGPVVTAAFDVIARDGVGAAVELLRRRGAGRTWTGFTVRRTFASRVYLGRVKYGDHEHADAHEPLVDRAVFERAQAALVAPERRRGAEAFPLSGVGSCGSCGGRLVGGRGGNDGRRIYRCADRCDAPVVVSAEPLERHVVAVIRAWMAGSAGYRVGQDDVDTGDLVAAVEDAERQLDEFASDLAARDMLGDRYHRHLQQRVDAVRDAEAALRDAVAAAPRARVVIPDELWDTLEPAELAEVLRGGLSTVAVLKGRAPIGERVVVVAKGDDGGVVPPLQDSQERGVDP